MLRAAMLLGAIVHFGCAPPTEEVGQIEPSTSGAQGSSASEATSSAVGPSSTETGIGDDEGAASTDAVTFDLGPPDLPLDEGCPGQTFCADAIPSRAVVSGMTPLGEVTLDHALFGPGKCDCFTIELGIQVVLSSAPLEPPGEDHPRIARLDVGILGGGTSPQEVGVDLHLDGMFDSGIALVELTTWPREPLEPDAATRVTGTIELIEAGWTLQGEFDAPLCYDVGFQIPCE